MKKKGFTLVELMIVITVIAILSTIAVVSFTRVQKQARDTKRKSDIRALATALQAYYTERNQYIVQVAETDVSTALTALKPTYIPETPVAPAGTTGNYKVYTYVTDSDGFKFALCSDLEAPSDPLKVLWVVNTQNMAGYAVADAAAACAGELK
ncbi:MAG: type II secretion system protein [bacterium]|nr:type II secretion system protein [bacterium]